MQEDTEFKRIHIFKGFVRTTKDYTDAVEYHIRKQALHNHWFHGRGVVPGVGGELRVRQRRSPEMAVEVRPGYALDPEGRDILVPEVSVKPLMLQDFVLPRTVYLRLQFVEEATDYRRIRIPGFPEREGFARVSEVFRLDWTVAEPDGEDGLEICRIYLTEEVTALRDAADPNQPGAGEIDLRWVRRAWVCGGSMVGLNVESQREALRRAIEAYTYMHRSRQIPSASAAATACVVLSVLNEAEVLDPASYLQCMELQRLMFREVVGEAELYEPRLAKRQNFRRFEGKVGTAGEVLSALGALGTEERREAVQMTVGIQGEGIEALHSLIRPPSLRGVQGLSQEMKAGTGIRVLDGTEWDRLKIDSRMPLATVIVEEQEWRLIDAINLLDPEEERSHKFAIREALDFWRSQVTLRYPDGVGLFDDGIGHKGGFAEWEIQNVTPGRPVVIVRRMDYGRGDYWARVWVNDVEAGEVPCHGEDTRYRWRNWPFEVSAHFVRHGVLRIKQAIDTSNRDVNYFRLWFYQPV
jgi:hypothetical protein